jgi:excisionase family DNA binding protein
MTMTKREVKTMMEDRLLSSREAAAYLGVSEHTIIYWRKAGKIECIRLGWRTVRVRRSELDRLKAQGTVKARVKDKISNTGEEPDAASLHVRVRQAADR